MIHEGAGEHAMEASAHNRVPTIRDDGIRRVLEGDTTIEEVMRVTTESL